MSERRFMIRTTAGAIKSDLAPSATKAGDVLMGWGGLVVLFRLDFERGAPIILLGPPKEESDF